MSEETKQRSIPIHKTLDQVLEKLTMYEMEVLGLIAREYIRAKAKHPQWPSDIIHAAAIVAEESGELIRAALQEQYEETSSESTYTEAIQTAAMGLRFYLHSYVVTSPDQK